MRYTSSLFAVLLAALLGPSAAHATLADPSAFDDRHVIREFSPETLRPVLSELKAGDIEQARNSADALYLSARMPSGLIVILTPSACSEAMPTVCRGLSMGAIFENPKGKPAADIDAALGIFNKSGIGTAFRLDESSVMYRDYLVADYGIAQGNVRIALQVFASYALQMREFLAQ